MKKILLILTILQLSLFGYEYDDLTLKAQTSVFPKLILLDKDISKKLVNDEILFSIVYQDVDKQDAIKVKELISSKFGGKLGKYKLKIDIKSYTQVNSSKKSTAYYILNSHDENMKQIAKVGIDNNVIVYTYDKVKFQNNILISLAIKDTTVIYINKDMLKEYKIDFVDSLYQIVKFESGK